MDNRLVEFLEAVIRRELEAYLSGEGAEFGSHPFGVHMQIAGGYIVYAPSTE